MSSTVDGDTKPPTFKPLPQLPAETSASGSDPPLLTVAALSHLRCLLAEGLLEEKLDIAWLLPLESSIHDLTKAVRKERWLTGAVKTRRGWSNLECNPKSPQQERETHTPEASEDGIENQIRRAVDAVINPSQGDDLAAQALSHLHERISKPTSPTSDEPNRCHLLLTLAPSKLTRPFPDLGVNFDLRPHREACTFTLGQFSLPLFDDKQTGGSTILAGFQEWKDLVASKKSPSFWTTVNIVGGKFTLSGVTAPSEHVSLAKVLRLGVYCALAMQLELSLQKDSGVTLIYPPPPVVRPPPVKIVKPPQVKDPTASPPPSGSTARPSRRTTKASSGIWGFLTRKTNEVIGRPSHGPTESDVSAQPGGLERPEPAVTAPATPTPAPSSPTSPISAHFPRVSLDLVRTLSNEMRLSWSDNFVQGSGSATRSDHAPGTLFSVLVDRIKAENVVLSTSPEVRFPPPSLLLQLAQRELAVATSRTSAPSPSPLPSPTNRAPLRLTGDDRTGLGCILGWSTSHHHAIVGPHSSVEGLAAEMTGTKAFLRHQSLTVLYAEHVPAEPDPAIKDLVKQEKRGKGHNDKGKEKEKEKEQGSEVDKAKAKAIQPSESSKSVSVSVEDSESRITTSTSTAESTISKATSSTDPNISSILGSESPPVAKVHSATKPCISAHWRTYRYFSRSHDHSLGEFVVKVCSAVERGDVCEREGCGRSRKLHGMDWVHAAVKVVGTLSDVEATAAEAGLQDASAGSTERDILIWGSCNVCKLETKKMPLSDGSL